MVLPDGSWPTHVPGEPKGDFDKYLALTEGPRCSEYWEDELASAVTCVFDGISNELRETVDGVVKTMKCVSVHKDRDTRKTKEKFDAKIKQVNKIQKGLDEKVRVVFQEEQHLKVCESPPRCSCHSLSLSMDHCHHFHFQYPFTSFYYWHLIYQWMMNSYKEQHNYLQLFTFFDA